MDEAKVKRAFEVARDAASDAAFHEQTQIAVFNRVFDAMLLEPWPFQNMATATGVDVMRGDVVQGRAMFCEHANEVPARCPCDADCYCKSHTCKPQQEQR